MMKRLISLILAAMMTLPVFPSGRKYAFKHITSADGLSASNVKCILRDSKGFMWFGTKNGLNVYDGLDIYHLTCFDHDKKHGNDNIGAIYEDKNGMIWIGTDRGIFLFDNHTNRFHYIDLKSSDGEMADNYVLKISGDSNDNIWAHIPAKGIFRFNNGKTDFFPNPADSAGQHFFYSDFTISDTGEIFAVSNSSDIYQFDNANRCFNRVFINPGQSPTSSYYCKIVNDKDKGIVLATLDGHLYRYNPKRDIEPTPILFSMSGNVYLRDIAIIGDDLWIGTHNGLYIINPESRHEQRLYKNPLDPFSLSDNSIFTIYQDYEGHTWIGTTFGGIDFLSSNPFAFHSYGLESNFSSPLVRALAADDNGHLWIATENSGLNLLDTASGEISQPAESPAGSSGVMHSIDFFDGYLYAGFAQSGIAKISADGKSFSLLPIPFLKGADNSGYSYLKDSEGNEWVGLGGKLLKRGNEENSFSIINATGSNWIFSLFEDSHKNIWIGTMGNGIWKYVPSEVSFKNYSYDDGEYKPNGLRSNSISSITEDSSGNVWFSTDRGGLCRYNRDTDDFKTYGTNEGMPDNVIYKVLEDPNGFLWFGTNKGLVKFNPRNENIKVFTMADGLPFNEFGYHAAAKDKNGIFYFGGINGLFSFNPTLDNSVGTQHPVYFTQVSPLEPAEDKDENLIKIAITQEVRFPYDNASFSVKVSSPEYGVKGERYFNYRLLPVSDDWIKIEGNKITFANLAPGKYSLEVRYGNDTDGAAISTLHIKVLPPWWKSNWAFCFYVLMGIMAVALLITWLHIRSEIRARQREKTFADEKERELYRNKLNFFTEIAHEIRTPLSLIDIPLEAIEENGLQHPNSARYLKITRQNTRRLLTLTNQLLDFQKLDSNKLTIKKERVDIAGLIGETAERFEPAIDVSNKKLEISLPEKPLVTLTDREALTKILSNLFNNALKYAKKDIKVTASESDRIINIFVTSDGDKIAKEEEKLIFDAFYQGEKRGKKKNGVGIGLPLSRSLATILGGELTLCDDNNPTNTFRLSIPAGMTDTTPEPVPDAEKDNYFLDEEPNYTKLRSDGYHILVVEDNDDIRNMLAEQLSRYFFIDTAQNGKEALDMVRNSKYDLVITDIMMPVMDGMELCKILKQDTDLSSTPIVFITAKNDLESKIKGLQLGAEAYIDKPFSIKYLSQTVKSLLENRRRERESFSRKPFFNVENMQTNKADEDFIKKCIDSINRHISEEDFNVESLCDLLAMSRSNLLRKIKTIFNMSPSELIRLVKLKKAAELIQDGRYRIGEICEMIGISSPSYFSKLFFKQFNITPKAFEKQCQEKRDSERKTDGISAEKSYKP